MTAGQGYRYLLNSVWFRYKLDLVLNGIAVDLGLPGNPADATSARKDSSS